MIELIKNIPYLICKIVIHWISLVLGARAFGQNNIPLTGGALIVSNHQSYMDPGFLSLGTSRPLHYLAKIELFESNSLFKLLISSVNAVPLERRQYSSEGIRKTIDYLSRGNLFIIFPEGTRTPDGKIYPFKPGMKFIASKAKVPIIPTRIRGAYKIWPKRSKLPTRLHPVSITYGKPIWPDKNISSQELCRQINEKVNEL